jgi:hypothetical protein
MLAPSKSDYNQKWGAYGEQQKENYIDIYRRPALLIFIQYLDFSTFM